jgi:hypothetical protein
MAPHNEIQLRELRLALVAIASIARTIGKVASEDDLLNLLPCLDFLLRYIGVEIEEAQRLCGALTKARAGSPEPSEGE